MSCVSMQAKRGIAGRNTGKSRAANSPNSRAKAVMNAMVVLAEDEDAIGSIVKQKLENAAIRVVWSKDGLDAWDTIRRERPVMAILDADMPGMSGYDLLTRIKADPATKDTVVVMLTALGHEAYVGNALRQGASDYIVKPFRPADLLERVQRLLNRRADPAAEKLVAG